MTSRSPAGGPESPDLRSLGRGHAAGDRFYVATLTFLRARQLTGGARPQVASRGHTAARVALMEVLGRLVVADANGSEAGSEAHEEL